MNLQTGDSLTATREEFLNHANIYWMTHDKTNTLYANMEPVIHHIVIQTGLISKFTQVDSLVRSRKEVSYYLYILLALSIKGNFHILPALNGISISTTVLKKHYTPYLKELGLDKTFEIIIDGYWQMAQEVAFECGIRGFN